MLMVELVMRCLVLPCSGIGPEPTRGSDPQQEARQAEGRDSGSPATDQQVAGQGEEAGWRASPREGSGKDHFSIGMTGFQSVCYRACEVADLEELGTVTLL